MVCSLQEAFELFLIPWYRKGTVFVLSVDGGKGGSEHCKIELISPGSDSFVHIFLTRSGAQKVLDLSSASFSYEDSRAGLVPELVARRWACFLLAEFPDGRSLLFSEPLQIG
jgi:hypothetical protein